MAIPLAKRFRDRVLRGSTPAFSTCREATELIGRSLQTRLGIRERVKVRLHLLVCNACRNYLSNLKFMKEVFEDPLLSDAATAEDALSDEARERIARSLEDV